MDELADILEHELESAVEVKDKPSLHRYIRLLVDSTLGKHRYESETAGLRSSVELIAERMEQGFKRMDDRFKAMDDRFEAMQTQMDRRFEQIDKRFDDINSRFRMMFTFITVGFTVLTAVTVLFKFLQ